MAILRIVHSVPAFDAWKHAFDSDPMDRRGSGVRRYRVFQSVSDSNLVMIDLEFDNVARAESLLEKLRRLWSGPARDLMRDPQAWIVDEIESVSL